MAKLKCFVERDCNECIQNPFRVEGKAFDNWDSIQRTDECFAPTNFEKL
jgi:hypothetical protein